MNLNQTKLLFIGVCIPARILFFLVPKVKNHIEKYLKTNTDIFYKLFGIVLLCMAIGFLYLYFFNKRLDAGEAGGNTWWRNLRLFHGLNYLCAALYILFGKIENASIPLGVDVLVGLLAHFNQHFFKVIDL